MKVKAFLNRLVQKARLALVALGLWGLRNIADRKLNDLLPHVFAVLDARLMSEIQKAQPTINIDGAIRSAIWEVLDSKATPDQVAIVRAIFDPAVLLGGRNE